MGQKVGDKVHELGDKAGEEVSELGQDVTEFTHDVDVKAHQLGDKVKGAYERAKPKAQSAYDEAKKFGKGFMGTVHAKAGGVSEMVGSVFGGAMGMQPQNEGKGGAQQADSIPMSMQRMPYGSSYYHHYHQR